MAKPARPYGSLLRKDAMLKEFQTRFVLPFGVFALCTLVVFGGFLLQRAHSLVVSRTGSEQLAAAQQTANGLEQAFGSAARLLDSVARSPISHAGSPRDIVPVLQGHIKHFDALSSIYLFDLRNNVLTSTDPSDSRSLTMMHDSCFQRITKSAETCFSDVVLEPDGTRVAYVYAPVFNQSGALYRIMAGSIPVGRGAFKDLVMGANPGKHGFALLADKSGAVALNGDTRTKPDDLPKNLDEAAPVKDALAGNKSTVKYKYGKTTMTASYVPVKGPNWALVVQRPASETGMGAGLWFITLLMIVFGAAGAVLVAVYQSQTVTRFLFQLGGRLDSLVQGKLDIELAAAGDNDEIARLSGSFNEMLRAYRKERQETEAAMRKAEETARFNKSIVDSMGDILLVLGTNTEVKLSNAAAARFCNVAESSMPGRTLEALGARWDKKQIRDAVLQAIRDNRAVTLSGVRMPDSEERNIELRVYPLEGKSHKKPDGVVIYGVRLSREITELIHENKQKVEELSSRQNRLERSEKYFRELIRDLSDSLFILDPDGRIDWSNGAAKKLISSDSKGFQGQRFQQLVAESFRGLFATNAQRVLETGAFLPPAEMILETPGGKKYVEASFSRAASNDKEYKLVLALREVPPERLMERSAAQSAVRDAASERERMERRIRFLSAAIDALPLAVAVTEFDGRIIQANHAFGKMFRQKREAFTGKSILSLHAGDSKFLALGLSAQMGEQRVETKLRPASGAPITAEAWAAPLAQGPSGAKALLCAFRDTGGQRAAVDKAASAAAQAAAQAARKAELENRTLRESTLSSASRDIAHRLHAPVAGVLQSLQQLGGNLFSEESRGIWQDAMRGGMNLNQSVNMMLLYANEQPLQTTVCDMNAIVQDTLDALKEYRALPPGLNISFQPSGESPACQADPEQMKMVLWNLALNAAQAVENQPAPEVRIKVFRHNAQGRDMMVVDVRDSGPEFDIKDADSFFEPFFGRREGGVGLGLTLSKRAIERHGGRIGIERKAGCTHVSFAFPVSGGAESPRPAASSRAMN